jgi:pyruvate kinase
MNRKAKIVATIGPATRNRETLKKLIEAGLDVVRMNFSHGSHEDHAKTFSLVRELSEEVKKPVVILQDLQGPKMRVGDLPEEGVLLIPGNEIIVASVENAPKDLPENIPVIPLDVPGLFESLTVGKHILLNDGYQELEVTEINPDYIKTKVVLGGKLTSHKGVNLPGADLKITTITEKDLCDLKFGVELGVDVVAMSFVRKPEDVITVRKAIADFSNGKAQTKIISKLERPEAIDNLEAILEVTDGVMVARGDLAIETSTAAVPLIQKRIIEAANRSQKIVITATQMLDSMIHNPRPTRAEASDVANAIFDGTDAVMLSGETAVGDYPVETVAMMAKIICKAESNFETWGHMPKRDVAPAEDDAISITRSSKELAHDRNVAAIAVLTQTGNTARLMSKARPKVPIIAFTPVQETYQQLGLLWGVTPFLVPYSSTVESMLAYVEEAIIANTDINIGDKVVFVSSFPVGSVLPPNFSMLHTLGNQLN